MTTSIRAHNPYSTPRRFRHNPYDLQDVFAFDDEQQPPRSPSSAQQNVSRGESPAGVSQPTDFANTMHVALAGAVNFERFPAFTANCATPMLPFGKSDCCRLFVGQLPYGTPAQQVEWMVFVATGRRVYFTETIQRWTGSRSPKGCAHTYCLPHDKDAIVAYLHRRVLVDDSGVWIAADEQQATCLNDYCTKMKNDKKLRFRDRPYQPVVVEEATSDFVPRRPSPGPEAEAPAFPPLYDQFVQAAQGFPSAVNMPPAYEQLVLPPQYFDGEMMMVMPADDGEEEQAFMMASFPTEQYYAN